jgi:hypothetical protein
VQANFAKVVFNMIVKCYFGFELIQIRTGTQWFIFQSISALEMSSQSQDYIAGNSANNEINKTAYSERDETGDSTYSEISEAAYDELNNTAVSHYYNITDDSCSTYECKDNG